MVQKTQKFDFIIAGGGLAGLSFAYRLKKTKQFEDKRLLILDSDSKLKNDRTWCFWSKEESIFEDIVHHRWPKIEFHSPRFSKQFQINPYSYKMIRGIDFYKHCLDFLNSAPNTSFINETIINFTETQDSISVNTQNNAYSAELVFKSYPDKIDYSQDHFVWQHFKGFFIETDQDFFDQEMATFMDFRVQQDDETRFFYVLPTAPNRALVELAIFSPEIPESSFYDNYLNSYIKDKLGISSFKILEEEVGAIPMTTYLFNKTRTKRIIPIGTNSGSVKASSGYAFSNIQKNIDSLVQALIDDKLRDWGDFNNRYKFYDKIFLNAILKNKTTGAKVFEALFKKLDPQTIFKFLDEEGHFGTDLKVFTAPPTMPFFKAFIEEAF